MILMIDNYDSFTYNLVQYLSEIYADIEVYRNDKTTPDEIMARKPRGIVISPGPCTPREAGISVDTVKQCAGRIPILGVCLGHQSIGYAFGGRVVRAPYLMHGKVSPVHHRGRGIYAGIENPFIATRYHSLILERETLPSCFTVTARTGDDVIMGIRHKRHALEGVQFHPESILTGAGKAILKNWVDSLSRRSRRS